MELRYQTGYWLQDDDTPICAGVVCRCADNQYCPLHGRKADDVANTPPTSTQRMGKGD